MSALQHIIIVGHNIEAWLPAAYLSARLRHDDYKITILETVGQRSENRDILARPTSKTMHPILHISESDLGRHAKARPALCAAINAADQILLPFGQYGIDRDGSEFQHHWKCAGETDAAAIGELADYNLAIAMHRSRIFSPTPPAGMPAYDYGYVLDESGYCDMLKKAAAKVQHFLVDDCNIITANGKISSIHSGDTAYKADFYIDASDDKMLRTKIDDSDAAWSGNCLSLLGGYSDGDHDTGMRLHRLQMAMERLIALWPDSEFAACEIFEYNRLTAAQEDHIADMDMLLSGSDKHRSPILERKINVYHARGRIAAHDYEIYSKAEWIAALSAAGITPQSHDRLAMRMDDDARRQWIIQLKNMIANMVQQANQGQPRKNQ